MSIPHRADWGQEDFRLGLENSSGDGAVGVPPSFLFGGGSDGATLVEEQEAEDQLGSNGILVSAEPWSYDKYLVRRTHQQLISGQDISVTQCRCGIDPVPLKEDVEVVNRVDQQTGEQGRSYFRGCVRCASAWSCPVCSVKIAVERGKELERAFYQALSMGWGVAFVTVTVSHRPGQPLAMVLGGAKDSWRGSLSCRRLRKLREEIGWVGVVVATEVTHGQNGWHPHLHCLVFTESPLTGDDLERLQGALYEEISKRLVDGHGLDLPSRERCVVVRRATARTAFYLTKMGLEIASHHTKAGRGERSRTAFQILEDYHQHAREEDGQLWLEYCRAVKGKQRLAWTRGLKDELGVREMSDEEAVDRMDEEAVVAVAIPKKVWWKQFAYRPQRQIRMLRLVDAGDIGGANRWIRRLERDSPT